MRWLLRISRCTAIVHALIDFDDIDYTVHANLLYELAGQMVFGHFSRCLYPLQKFDSDTERRFAVILERDADKWFKPAKGQFQVFYKLGVEQPEYVPDFVVETAHYLLMVETKARNELGTDEVKAKAEAGALWCKHASDHARTHSTKPWKYLLVPHDQVTEDKSIADYFHFEQVAKSVG